ncbi:MAG: biotin transporter BioY [Pseudomonadota bacterium]
MTLSRALFPTQTVVTQVGLVLAGTLLIALAARASVGWPVPMTLQTLAILVVGFTYGARLGTVTLLVYLAQGAMGLPVFAGGNAGLPYMMGATGGFLLGFVVMAFVAGYAADQGLAKTFVGTLAAALVASLLIYLPGLAWPAALMGKPWDVLWTHWMSPFLLGDAIKAALAALVVTGAWSVYRRR